MGKVKAELGLRVYLDTNIVIYAVEGLPHYAAQVQPLLDAMDAGEVFVVSSELTLAEVLIGPLKAMMTCSGVSACHRSKCYRTST
jgi:hypothetical protein